MGNKHNKMTDFTIEALIKGDISTVHINQHLKNQYPELVPHFDQLMKLVLKDDDFDVEQPNIETFQHLEVFVDCYTRLIDWSKSEIVTVGELIKLDAEADYIDETPGPVFAVHSLLNLLSMLSSSNKHFPEAARSKDEFTNSFYLAISHHNSSEEHYKLAEIQHVSEINKFQKQKSNRESHQRKLAIIDYIAELATYALWVSPKRTTDGVFCDVCDVLVQDHSNKLHTYFRQRETMSSSLVFKKGGEVIIASKDTVQTIKKVKKYILTHRNNIDLKNLTLQKPPVRSFDIGSWNNRERLPQYPLILKVASMTIDSIGLENRLRIFLEKKTSNDYISPSTSEY